MKIAIKDLMKYKEAVERMEEFGKMFLQYSRDPRGMIGEAGYVESGDMIERAKECVMHYETITDVDGNVWRPVLEDKLQFLIRCMTERAEKAEKEIERLKDIMRDRGVMVIPSKYPGCKSEWNLPRHRAKEE